MLNTKGCEKMSMNSDRRCASIRLLSRAKQNPHEMASEKGNVKVGRKIRPPQIIERLARRTGRFSQLAHPGGSVNLFRRAE
jgi:hypothetical protein